MNNSRRTPSGQGNQSFSGGAGLNPKTSIKKQLEEFFYETHNFPGQIPHVIKALAEGKDPKAVL